MGLLDFLAKKKTCESCGKPFPVKKGVPKRGMLFCSPDCAAAYDRSNPMPVPKGDPGTFAAAALEHLTAAHAELKILNESFMGGDGMSANILEFEKNVILAAPYLYAIGMEAEADALQSHDFQAIHGMSSIGAGALQYARIVNIVQPALFQAAAAIEKLGKTTSRPAP
jgi:hypothetical protein